MSSVGKRRRERIRAKKALREEAEAEEFSPEALEHQHRTYTKDLSDTDGHVSEAPGRSARRQRKDVRRKARTKDDSGPSPQRSWLSFWTNAGAAIAASRPSLGRRRAKRRREKLRRDHLDRPAERVRERGVVYISWRWLSGAISIFLLVILYIMLATDIFIVDTIAVGQQRYLSPEQVFEAAGIANSHLFWIDPREVAVELESNPSISDAQVQVGWPPNMVSIVIQERDPTLIWEQAGFPVWVDINGIVMFPREEREDLLRIVYRGEDLETLGVGSIIDREIVAGALQLQQEFPTIRVLLYDPIKGLGFRSEGNWVAWFGIGTNMEQRRLVYDQIVREYGGIIQFREIDVSDPDYAIIVDRFPDQE